MALLCFAQQSPDMATLIELDDVTPRIAYTATAGQTVFIVPFVFFADADLDVYVDDVLQSSGYTVAGALDSDEASRKITFTTALVGGESVVIVRDIAIARTSNFPISGPLQISALNIQLAKIFAIQQQLSDEIDRTLRLASSDPVGSLQLPAVAARASKYLAFDADGNPSAVAAVTGTAAVAAFWVTALQTADAAAARGALGITDNTAYIAAANALQYR